MKTKEEINQLLNGTFQTLRNASISQSYAIDIILFLSFWSYASDMNKIEGNLSLSAFLERSRNTIDGQKLIKQIVKRLNDLSESKADIINGQISEMLIPLNAVVDLWHSQTISKEWSRHDVNHFFICLEDFIGYNFINASEYYTPNDVVQLLTKVISSKKRASIYDPFCRTGNLLNIAAASLDIDQKTGKAMTLQSYQMAKIWSLMLDDKADIELASWFKNEENIGFDLVITNPPFSVPIPDMESQGAWAHEFQGAKSDVAILAHSIDILSKSGTCGIILPMSVLLGSGIYQRVRQRLINENLLEAVISLPHKLFFGTGVQTVVLILQKDRKNKDVFFYNATKLGIRERSKNSLSSDDISLIQKSLQLYRAGAKLQDEDCIVLSDEEIRNNNYVLHYSSHGAEKLVPNYRSPKEVLKECIELEKELVEMQNQFQLKS